jgi:bifunctional DNA primase/polymerase-like protein
VDWRGRGGYVVAPPSRHLSGARYRWLRRLTSDLPHTPGPLQTLLLPAQQQRRPQAVSRFREEAAGHPYGRAALEEELGAVAQAPQGRRNHTLYQAGIRLYSLVAGGVLDHAEVHAGLLAAADANRLLAEEPTQTRRTLASAERTGLAYPRGIPASDWAPRPAPTRRPQALPTRPRDDHERDA